LTALRLSGDSVDDILPGKYYFNNYDITFSSNLRKTFYFTTYYNIGKYYTSLRQNGAIDLNYRYQPWGIFNINYNVNYFQWASGNRSTIHLLGAKAEISFTKNLYFTTFLQYNTQAENINLNIRLQWRFKPMSDFFIVYTDNYDPNLGIKKRAIVGKLVWWITL
jgi:hypothetical protein